MCFKVLVFVLFSLSYLDIDAAELQCLSGVECIPLQDCHDLYDQLRQGNAKRLTPLLQSLHCGFNNLREPKVCCPPEFLVSRLGSSESLLPDFSSCGIQGDNRIVGGSQTDIDEHPWMALLRYDKPKGWGFYCGGVLISRKYVLTAAHCVKGQDLPTDWRLSQVRLGEWNTTSNIDCFRGDCNQPPLDVNVEEIIAHPNYDPNDVHQENDIALLRLNKDVPYTERTGFIQPICLPSTNELRSSTFEGINMDVAGWGTTETRSESDVKLKVRVPVVTKRECQRVYQRKGRRISSNQICAGGTPGRDSCRGDSGGALMTQVQGPNGVNWIAAGVVSYGPSPCGTPNWPGVYTRVGAYVDWIQSQIKP